MCIVNPEVKPRRKKMATKRSSMEESGTHDATKVSDSGYSNSCSNSQSQRSSGSSESRHSSSSGSSGYCGHQSTLGSISEGAQAPPSKRKEKDHKKKKSKAAVQEAGAAEVPEAKPPTPQEASSQTAQQQTTETVLVPNAAKTPSSESDALQIAALTHTLSCIKKLKAKDEESPTAEPIPSVTENQENLINSLKAEAALEEELSIVVSLKDGVVAFTSPNLTEMLGYPKDMWVGRSLIDFIHPKHRAAFASHITWVIAGPNAETDCATKPVNGSVNGRRSQFFCCLRQYRGLRSCGFSITDKPVSYLPCQLKTTFREVPDSSDPNNNLYLVITATAVRSVYKYADEVLPTQTSAKFTTRHLGTTCLSYVDPEVTSHFGYLPQDMLGRSVFDFYHHEDLPGLKEDYETVMKDQSKPVRGRPYRFRCQNGGFALIETEWSTFINPWTHKMEFIIGQHCVLRGPSNPDVTTPVELEPFQMSENVMKETKQLQDQIKCLLNEMVIQTNDSMKQEVSKRCKDLATFLETLVEAKSADLKVEVQTEDQSFSERDSVMLGEISPHHDYYNSNSSSGTPPSYNQLNYNENLQRFFESKPKTTLSDESGDSKNDATIPCTSSGEDDKTQPAVNLSDTSVQSRTSSGQSTGSNSHGNGQERQEPANTQQTQMNGEEYKPPMLTEQILTKHNEDMEKKMMQKHRESRNKSENKIGKERHKCNHDKTQGADDGGGGQPGCSSMLAHGVKRSGSHSWEGEPYKSLKTRTGTEKAGGVNGAGGSAAVGAGVERGTNWMTLLPGVGHQPQQPSKPLNLWPPFSVGVMPLHTTQPTFTTPTVASPLLPMYYISEPRHQQIQHSGFMPPQVSYVPDTMLYPLAMFGTPPVVYSPLTVLPTPVYSSQSGVKLGHGRLDGNNQGRSEGGGGNGAGGSGVGGPRGKRPDGGDNGRPQSRATSVKAEPGSALCSVASASLQQPLSEKGKTVSSPGCFSPTSISPQVDSKEPELDADSSGTSNVCDDSSIYSSFDSYLKTDKSDESMKSSSNEGKIEEMIWEKSEKGARPIKKLAPWLEDINVDSDLIFKYQVQERKLCDVLEEDSKALAKITQPTLVNDQLSQMYLDLELEGLSKHLTLDEGITSSSESSGEETSPARTKKKRYMEYEKMVILFEENAPLPPPTAVTS